MKNLAPFLLTLFIILSCNNNNAPDVSHIPVDVRLLQFEQFLFEKMDTSDIAKGLPGLEVTFPFFTKDFIVNILGLPEVKPGVNDSAAAVTFSELKRFIRLTRPLYDSMSPKFHDVSGLETDLTEAFKYVKYYFPTYNVPRVLTYIGPFNAPAIAITNEAIAIGLQMYAGRNFSFYTSTAGQELYPMYISRRFEPSYIPVDCMKAVAEDLFPDRSQGQPFIAQMIEKGKRWHLLDNFLPGTHDSLKTGFTQQQLEWCNENEGLIWNFFLKNIDIYTTDPGIIKIYLGESPHTQGMPDIAPGNIGQWVGWKISKAYAAKHPQRTPEEIMKTNYKEILAEAKYKPGRT